MIGRRALLKAIGLTIPALTLPTWSYSSTSSDHSSPTDPIPPLGSSAGSGNPIIEENKKPGTTAWQITNASDGDIEGYTGQTSINRGEFIELFVTTAEPSYTLEVFRLGWYGGTGGRRVFGPIALSGMPQPVPVPHAGTGLIECKWANPFILPTSGNWTTGVYLVLLTTNVSGKQSYIPFTLRDDAGASQLLFQTSVTTYQAYNNWGGKSLYAYNSTDEIPAVKVSFNRPYRTGHGAGDLFNWELSMLRFLEREGYDLAYCCNITTHNNPSLLQRRKAFLSVGHDEYWSWEMRRNITAARDEGIHLGFFSANSCYWQIRLEPSAVTATPNRTIICYRDHHKDPLAGADNARVTQKWRDTLVNHPEEQFIGVQFIAIGSGDIVVSHATHFIFEGTGLRNGDRLPGLAGPEVDGSFGGGPPNLIQLCASPITTAANQVKLARMTIYTANSGALVFATGSIQFSYGLDDGANAWRAKFANPAAQRMVRNLFRRFR